MLRQLFILKKIYIFILQFEKHNICFRFKMYDGCLQYKLYHFRSCKIKCGCTVIVYNLDKIDNKSKR